MSKASDISLLNSILYYGYPLPNECVGLPASIRESVSQNKSNAAESVLVEEGKQALRDSMATITADLPTNATHLLPLSGGLDSRMVLGLLAETVDRSQIQTVTIGLPIGWDYEIGQRVAREANVPNRTVNPTAATDEWTLDNLVDHAATYAYPNRIIGGYLQTFAREKAMTDADGDCVVWSGFMGETVAGAHIDKYGTGYSSWEQACKAYASANQLSTIDFSPSGFEPTTVLPTEPWVSQDALSYTEQLDFAIRQQCWIRQTVAPDAHAPFTRSPWLEFMLNVPPEYREDRSLFKAIGKEMFPDLFRLPTETNDGVPLGAGDTRRRITVVKNAIRYRLWNAFAPTVARPEHQFMDFDAELRREWHFRETIETLVSGIAQRNLSDWFDPLEIWKRHQSGENLSRDIRILASLEAFLRSEETDLDQSETNPRTAVEILRNQPALPDK